PPQRPVQVALEGLTSPLFCTPKSLAQGHGGDMPIALISRRRPHAATPRTATLATQIPTSHPSRLAQRQTVACMTHPPRSVIALSRPDLATKHIVGPGRVHENNWNDEEGSYEGKTLALRRPRRLPQINVMRNDVGPDTDAQAAVSEEDQRQREHKRACMGGTVQCTKEEPRTDQHERRYGHEPIEIRQTEPALANLLVGQRRPEADDDNDRQQHQRQGPSQCDHATLQIVVCFHDQPSTAQKRIGRNQAQAGEERERPEPIEGTADELTTHHLDAVDVGAQRDTLEERGDHRSPDERLIPQVAPFIRGLEPKFEGDATENESEQHEHQRQHEGTEHHGVGQWKCSKQSRPAQHKPRLVAIPDRRNRVHHHVAVLLIGEKGKQDANAQVKAVHDDIHQNAEKDDDRPDQRKVDAHGQPLISAVEGSPGSVAADNGRAGVRRSPGPPSGWCASSAAGPRLISLSMYTVPAPNTAKYTTMNNTSVRPTSTAPCGLTASAVRMTPYTTHG